MYQYKVLAGSGTRCDQSLVQGVKRSGIRCDKAWYKVSISLVQGVTKPGTMYYTVWYKVWPVSGARCDKVWYKMSWVKLGS